MRFMVLEALHEWLKKQVRPRLLSFWGRLWYHFLPHWPALLLWLVKVERGTFCNVDQNFHILKRCIASLRGVCKFELCPGMSVTPSYGPWVHEFMLLCSQRIGQERKSLVPELVEENLPNSLYCLSLQKDTVVHALSFYKLGISLKIRCKVIIYAFKYFKSNPTPD